MMADKAKKKPNPFNRMPINPPKDWVPPPKAIPNRNYRTIPR